MRGCEEGCRENVGYRDVSAFRNIKLLPKNLYSKVFLTLFPCFFKSSEEEGKKSGTERRAEKVTSKSNSKSKNSYMNNTF